MGSTWLRTSCTCCLRCLLTSLRMLLPGHCYSLPLPRGVCGQLGSTSTQTAAFGNAVQTQLRSVVSTHLKPLVQHVSQWVSSIAEQYQASLKPPPSQCYVQENRFLLDHSAVYHAVFLRAWRRRRTVTSGNVHSPRLKHSGISASIAVFGAV